MDWKGNVENSLALAHYLGIDPDKIIVYDKPNKPLDATLVMGSDWTDIKQRLEAVLEQLNGNE